MTAKKQYKTVIGPSGWDHFENVTTSEILDRGHRPIGIRLAGRTRNSKKDTIVAQVPADVGTSVKGYKIVARKNVSQRAEVNGPNIGNLKPGGLESLKKWLGSERMFSQFDFTVRQLTTQNRETEQICVWKRSLTKNGTKQKGLILVAVDNKPFTAIDYKEIVSAADDMVDSACKYLVNKIEYVSPHCQT